MLSAEPGSNPNLPDQSKVCTPRERAQISIHFRSLLLVLAQLVSKDSVFIRLRGDERCQRQLIPLDSTSFTS